MKAKHNKKRNTAFLYEALIRELTKTIIDKNHEKSSYIKSIFKEHFTNNSELQKELNCYKALNEADSLDQYTAEKLVFAAKKEYESLNQKRIFTEQSKVIKKINKGLGTDVYKNFVPNYRAYATISQIFNDATPVKTRVLLEKQIIGNLVEGKSSKQDLKPVDSLVVKSFSSRLNEEYGTLLPEQKHLLGKYILSFGQNEPDFKILVGSELKRIYEEVKKSLTLEEVKTDPEMVTNTKKVLEDIQSLNVSNLTREDILKVLKLQNLVHEYSNDADHN